MNKIEQPIISQKVQLDMNLINKLMELLEIGKKSTHIIRSLIIQNYPNVNNNVENNYDPQDYYKTLDHHSMVSLDSYLNSISMLKSFDFDGGFVENRKLNDHQDVISLDNPCKCEVFADQESPNMSIVSNRRDSYKKRKIIDGDSREEEVTQLTHDGFAWRKYGQKMILNYDHPRQYYRCTHKPEKNCQATKQIQQISDNPTKYKVIYHGNHICNNIINNNNNILNTFPYIIDDKSLQEHPSTIVVSFDNSNPVNPFIFPSSRVGSGSDNRVISNPKESEHVSQVEVAENHKICSSSKFVKSWEEHEKDYDFIMSSDFSKFWQDWWNFEH